jgi:hypothetical protein
LHEFLSVAAPKESLDTLIDEHGWAYVLTALVEIAERDGFDAVADSLDTVISLICDQGAKD